MKKKTLATLKKSTTVKEEQKITAFFNKLSVNKNKKTAGGSKSVESNSKLSTNIIPCQTACVERFENSSTKPVVIKNKNQDIETVSNNSDSDFILDKKKKVNSLLVEFKSKHKFIYDKSAKPGRDNKNIDCNNEKLSCKTKEPSSNNEKPSKEKRAENFKDEKAARGNYEAHSRIKADKFDFEQKTCDRQNGDVDADLATKPLKFDENKKGTFFPQNNHGKTAEKLSLRQQEPVLLDITYEINCSQLKNTNITSERDKKLLAHSTPVENCKKRKLESNSPDVIPPTPEETFFRMKSKSKLCLENKFHNSEPPVVQVLTKSPPNKKQRILNHGMSPENSLESKSTSKFRVTPVKNITPSKSSPHKGEITLFATESSESSSKTKRALFKPLIKTDPRKELNADSGKGLEKSQEIADILCKNNGSLAEIQPRKESEINGDVIKANENFAKFGPKKLPSEAFLSFNEQNISSKYIINTESYKEPEFKVTTDITQSSGSFTKTESEKIPELYISEKVFNSEEQNISSRYFTNDSDKEPEESKVVAVINVKNKNEIQEEKGLEVKVTQNDEQNDILNGKPFEDSKNSKDITEAAEELDGLFNETDVFEFNDEWEEEIKQVQNAANDLDLTKWQYCIIIDITNDVHQHLIVKLQSIDTKLQSSCVLKGIWSYSILKSGDRVNILAAKSDDSIPFFVDNNEGFLIFEPDLLISPTSIVGSQFCKRRGILAEKFRGFESENKIMIIGTLVHRLLEESLYKNIYSQPQIDKKLTEILASKEIIYLSYSSQVSVEEMKTELQLFVPKIVNFVQKYVKGPKKKHKSVNGKEDNWQGCISSIQDIEENIWCPQLGIKGKVDITVKTEPFEAVLPLELKTGRASMSLEHRGQVIMYSMIMTELGYRVSSGLLLYLREDTLKEVSASHREKRDLIMLRNEFAYYMKQLPEVPETKPQNNSSNNSDESVKLLCSGDCPKIDIKQLKAADLPEPINHHSACGRCPYVTLCSTFLSRDTNNKLADNHPLKAVSVEATNHLESSHIDYFIHWTSLLTLESNYQPPLKELKNIWRLPPYKRELRSKSISYLKISGSVSEDSDSYIHTFIRSSDETVRDLITEKGLTNDFLVSGLTSGKYVIVNTDARVAVATGFIKHITPREISVSLERNLLKRYSNKTFHIDTYESQQTFNFSMTSLATLMEPTDEAKRLRELVIDKKPPVLTEKLPKSIISAGAQILRKLNKVQQRAVLKVLTAKDYLLIKGMPGTGKTATVVALIQLLVLLKKTVLITSHTHSAVDNVCLRLLDFEINFLRLGSSNRVHSNLKHRTEEVLTSHCKTAEELKAVYDEARVVAVTCLGASHPVLSQRKFDVCLVDESTQVVQSSVLKALLSASTFVLVGDPNQLPPVIRNPEAARRGMSESLFERLDNPSSTVTLTIQYRMNQVITDLANSVTYNGQLVCADDKIASATLKIPEVQDLSSANVQKDWLMNTLSTKLEHSVVAIDTGPTWNIKKEMNECENTLLDEIQVAAQNAKEDEERKCDNYYEASLVYMLIKSLKESGVASESIGIIAPYRAQVALLRELISKIYREETVDSVEINTVDQFQGRDKELIIYSCTRSRNDTKRKINTRFEILEDKRRLTVALTRAKHKLVLIGDFSTLEYYSPFNKLLHCLNSTQKIVLNKKGSNFKWEDVIENIGK